MSRSGNRGKMADIEVTLTDNSDEILRAMEVQMDAALEAIGNQAVSHAKQNITQAGRVDTGAMRNSVNHHVWGNDCYIGTNISYAKFHEMGTGIYADGGGGRQEGWFYVDEKGEGHFTRGLRPIHFLKRAAADHVQEYIEIVKKFLRGS